MEYERLQGSNDKYHPNPHRTSPLMALVVAFASALLSGGLVAWRAQGIMTHEIQTVQEDVSQLRSRVQTVTTLIDELEAIERLVTQRFEDQSEDLREIKKRLDRLEGRQ